MRLCHRRYFIGSSGQKDENGSDTEPSKKASPGNQKHSTR